MGTKMTPIGELRHRLTLEAPEETPDGAGGVSRIWTAAGRVWAAVEAAGMSEAVVADKRIGRITHRIVLRRRDGLTVNHRFRLGARVLAIRAIRDAEPAFLEVLAEEERP